jgi:hypothetical protein
VLAKDQDIYLHTKHLYITVSICKGLGLDIQPRSLDLISNQGNRNNTNHIDGRVYLDKNSVDSIVDLIENARYACLPKGLAARYSISRLIDSQNCYEPIHRGFVISRSYRQESIHTVEEIFAKDKGGMIYSP